MGGTAARSFHSRMKQARHSISSAWRASSEALIPESGCAVATSDQRVSLRRSSHGKSNRMASICVVSSMDTQSTQSKVSPTGRASSTAAARARIAASIPATFAGENMGLTTPRWPPCFGGSMAMNIGSGKSLSWSRIVMPPRLQSEENAS